jgi:hypothetical protein
MMTKLGSNPLLALALLAGAHTVVLAQDPAPKGLGAQPTGLAAALSNAKGDWDACKIPSSLGMGFAAGGDGGGVGMVFNFRFKIIGVDYLYQPHQDADVDTSIPHSDYSSIDRKMEGYSVHAYIPVTPKKNVSVMVGRATYTYSYLAQSNVTGLTWSGGGGSDDAGSVNSYGFAWSAPLRKSALQSGDDKKSSFGVEVRHDKLRGFSLIGNWCF